MFPPERLHPVKPLAGERGEAKSLAMNHTHSAAELHTHSRMGSALHLELRAGLHRVAVLTLALVVFAFALQPCFAVVAPTHPCCPTQAPACHPKAHPEACTMSNTGFGSPEETSGLSDMQAQTVPVIAFEVPAPLTSALASPAPTCAQVAPFLLNSVLLI